jgi:polyhydroxyalkanoate synthesis regulator phasin
MKQRTLHSTRTKLTCLVAGIMASAAVVGPALAQSSEALIDALIRKGILTEQEAEDIKADLAQENNQANKVKASGKETRKIEIYGDFRGRFEGFYSEYDEFLDRNRWRYRARVGLKADLTDHFEVGFRLGSGEGADPISQNQTLQDNGSKKNVYIDLAYGRWFYSNYPLTHWSGGVTLGKMENPFVLSDAMFDRDYTPEGFGLEAAYQFNLEHKLSLTAGGFVLDELGGSSHDPYMVGPQLRYDSTWKYNEAFKPKIQSSLSATYLVIGEEQNLGNGAVPNINAGNTRDAAGNLVAEFRPIVADASLTYTLGDYVPLYNGFFPIKVGGDYIYNTAISEDNQGYSVGITFGKASTRGTWELGYRWKYLESDVWYEEVVDSDFGAYYAVAPANSGRGAGYNSGTNTKGHIVKLSYAPVNALLMSLTWFRTELVDEPAGQDGSTMNRVQVDALLKF